MNPNDRYLTFTLSGAALADPLPNPLPQAGEGANVAAAGSSFGPHDAFEVALLDANRGGSLLNNLSLAPLAGNVLFAGSARSYTVA
ncbi:MAG TPA: hypothetical protein VFR06_09925 [Gallionellaceae bacterium]|nr:hypothetical protein [Gallionellaceae bacterium]